MMTERESMIVSNMYHCVINGGLCNNCPNYAAGDDVCYNIHKDFYEMAQNTIAQRDALLADLNLACGGKFVDTCCICGHYTPEHPGEKCELKGLDCRWEWRGVQHG